MLKIVTKITVLMMLLISTLTLTTNGVYARSIYDATQKEFNDRGVNVKWYGAKGDGVADDSTAFNNFITAAGSNDADLLLPRGTYKITSNITMPSNIAVSLAQGAIFSIESGVTVTISGKIKSGTIKKIGKGNVVCGSQSSDKVYASVLGLIPNDMSEAINNANKLVLALNTYGYIIIDDSYYLDQFTETLTTTSVKIYGMKNGELKFNRSSSVVLFDPQKLTYIEFDNVKITNENDSKSVLIFYNDSQINTYLSKVIFNNCEFYGNISLYRHNGDTNLNPETTQFGVGEFTFVNNTVRNTLISFIKLVDVPFNKLTVENNYINNFAYTFINLGITNGSTYESKLYSAKKYVSVKNNYVICDDDFWGPTEGGLYYTFFLFEGKECIYDGNHVEGLKAHDDIALYDAYISCDELTYTNNVWKNNICFNSAKTNNTLIKSKSGGAASLKRLYRGNKYIVEKDFATRLSEDTNNLFVSFMSLTKLSDDYVIDNNYFDVYDLRFSRSSNPYSNIKITNNTFNCKKASGYLVICGINDSYVINNITVKNNTINIEAEADAAFGLIRINDNRIASTNLVKRIVVDGNSLEVPLGYLLYTPYTDNLTIVNNTIYNKGNGNSGFICGGKYTNSYIDNNYVKSIDSITMYEGRQSYGSGIKNEAVKFLRKNITSSSNGLQLDSNNLSIVPTYYRRYYKFNTPTGVKEFYFDFSVAFNNTSGYTEVTFKDTSDVLHTYRINKNDGVTDGNNTRIKLIDAGDTANTFIVVFFNSSGYAGFYINNLSGNIGCMEIETTASQ